MWTTVRAASLDEIEGAHAAIGGTGPGRRYATRQVNHAYTVLLSSQFQGFCRDLHTECVDAVVRTLPRTLQPIAEQGLPRDRKLDRGNPNPGNLGADFGRFDFNFWGAVYAADQRNERRRVLLDELNEWRNAIAHQDFARMGSGGGVLQLRQVRGWRAACDALARSFEEVLFRQMVTLSGVSPW